MRRRQRIFFLYLLAALLCVVLPITLTVNYPHIIANISTGITFLFFLGLVVLFIFPLSQKKLQTTLLQQEMPYLKWLIAIIAIELLTTALFVGQTYTITQYQAHYQKLTLSSSDKLFWQQLWYYFKNWSLFPWAFIAMATICFNRVSYRYQTAHPLTKTLPIKEKNFHSLLRRIFDIYIASSTMAIVGFALAFACIQISLIIFPSYNPAFNVLYGMVTATFIILITNTNVMKKIFSHTQESKLAPTVNIIFQLFVTVIILLAASLIMAKLNLRTERISRMWQPLEIFAAYHVKAIAQLWFFSWWVIVTPLISSLINKISHNKNARLALLAILLPPYLAASILHFIPFNFISTLPPVVIQCIQLIALFAVLILFGKKEDNQLLWFGYRPTVKIKKLRVVHMKFLWVVSAAFLGVFAISGSQSLILLGITASIGVIVIFIVAFFRSI